MSIGLWPITRETCELYEAAIAAGEAQESVIGYLATKYDVQRPAIWKRLRAGGLIPEYGCHVDGKPVGRTAAGIRRAEPVIPLAPPVDRDPCPRCGTRHDIGCRHSRAPVGMMFGAAA